MNNKKSKIENNFIQTNYDDVVDGDESIEIKSINIDLKVRNDNLLNYLDIDKITNNNEINNVCIDESVEENNVMVENYFSKIETNDSSNNLYWLVHNNIIKWDELKIGDEIKLKKSDKEILYKVNESKIIENEEIQKYMNDNKEEFIKILVKADDFYGKIRLIKGKIQYY